MNSNLHFVEAIIRVTNHSPNTSPGTLARKFAVWSMVLSFAKQPCIFSYINSPRNCVRINATRVFEKTRVLWVSAHALHRTPTWRSWIGTSCIAWVLEDRKKNCRTPVDTDSWNRLQYWLITSHFGWDSQDAVFKAGTSWLRETTPKENTGPPVWGLGVKAAIAWGIFTQRSETFLSRYTHCITTTHSTEYISQRNCHPPAVCDS
jgi:hypothetical protein